MRHDQDEAVVALRERFGEATYDRPVEHVYEASRRRRQRRRGGLLALAGIVAVTAFVLWSPFGSEPTALAGWTPEPHEASPAVVNAADPLCRSVLADEVPEIGELGWTDLRGQGLLIAYPTPTAVAVCMQVDHGNGFGAGGTFGVTVDLEPLTGALRVDSVATIESDNTGVTVVIGQSSTDVARVEVTAPGWSAIASQHGGFWLAWWPVPTDAAEVSVTAYDGTGSVLGSWTPDVGEELAPTPPATTSPAHPTDG